MKARIMFVTEMYGLLYKPCMVPEYTQEFDDQHQTPACIQSPCKHNNDVIMGAIVSQNTSLTFVFSTVYLDTYQRKDMEADEFPAQMASNAENVSIW